MSFPVEEKTKFNITHDSMLRDSRTTQVEFVTDQFKFGAYDSIFKTPFNVNWLAAIVLSENEPNDGAFVFSIRLLSDIVEVQMDACRDCFQSAKHFIEKAFPAQTDVWNQFGYSHYEDARKNHDKMFRFMTNFQAVAELHQVELIAAGYIQTSIDNILIIRDALTDAITAQHLKMNARVTATVKRIKQLNAVWDFRTAVSRASKDVFKLDYASYNKYLLPASEENPVVLNVKGVILDQATLEPVVGAHVILGANLPEMVSDSTGVFGAALIPAGTYNAHVTLTGYVNKDVSIVVVDEQDTVLHIELTKIV